MSPDKEPSKRFKLISEIFAKSNVEPAFASKCKDLSFSWEFKDTLPENADRSFESEIDPEDFRKDSDEDGFPHSK